VAATAQRSNLWWRGCQKVKANQGQMREFRQNQVPLVRRKIILAFFVQCNILPVMRAVELRKVQAKHTVPIARRPDGRKAQDDQEFR
jgi:hypothetical protein